MGASPKGDHQCPDDKVKDFKRMLSTTKHARRSAVKGVMAAFAGALAVAFALPASAHAAPNTGSISVHQIVAHQNSAPQPGTPIQHQYQQLH